MDGKGKKGLEQLVHKHERFSSGEPAHTNTHKHLLVALLFLFIFFLSFFFPKGGLEGISGMVTAAGGAVADAAGNTVEPAVNFVHDVRYSPDRSYIKIFFYGIWVMVVGLAVAMIHFEDRKNW